jgi:PAS domain S-box-containing protein
MELCKNLLSPDFMPHGYCYLWDPRMVWLHVISDGLITLSYYCIPVILIYFIRKNRDLPFNRIFWMFGTFILACGTTHLMEIWNVWHGDYLMAGVVKAITAAVSVLTALMLIPLIPKVISLPGRMHLQEMNRKLVEEIAERKRFDAPIDAPLRHRVTVGFIVAVLLTLFIGFSSWQGAKRAEQDAYWVSHTHEVMETIQRATRHVIEAETSARAFSLTGQERLLANYTTARKSVYADECKLRQLTADNLSQQRRLDVLEPQLRTTFDFGESIIAKRRKLQAYSGGDDALETERLLDVVRATTRDMYAEEKRLLSQRTQRAGAGQRLARIIALAGALLAVGLWSLARLAVNREIEVSARARAQINTLNAELEQRVEQRTAALESEIADRTRADRTREDVLKELADQKFALDQHAIVAVTDVQGTITYVNDKFCTISQYSEAELIGQNHRILNSGQHPKEFFQLMYHTIANGGVWHGEIQNRAKDGSIYWVDTTIVPFVGADGKPRQYVAIRADITERKLAAASLAAQALELSRQAEELARSRQALETQTLTLRSVLDSMTEGLAAVDDQGKFVIWNAAAERILGMGASDLPNAEWSGQYGLFMPDTVTPFPTEQLPVLRAIRGEVSTTEMYVRNHRLPQGAWIEVSAGPRKGGDGMVCGGVAAFRDVTKRKEDEREIQKLSDELEHRVIVRTAQLETANKELEAFSYSVSHDLRAPLRHIGGFSKLLVEEFASSLDPIAQYYVERIQSGTQKMGLLVDELLNLARVGRHALSLQPYSLNSIVAEVIAILQPDSQGRHVKWVIADLPAVECDPVLVKQVFQNLLANALKFTRPRVGASESSQAGMRPPTLRTVIEVTHKEQDGQPVFMVRDNGVGFSMKYVDKLFGVFQRLHSAEEFEGTGIGLVTVQRIVQKHGGRVWAQGEPDKGATFYFTLGVEKQVQSKNKATIAGGQS